MSLTFRFGPKTLFISGLIANAVIILLMGFVSDLPVLLALRVVQGILDGISTVGLAIVSGSSSPGMGIQRYRLVSKRHCPEGVKLNQSTIPQKAFRRAVAAEYHKILESQGLGFCFAARGGFQHHIENFPADAVH